MIKVHILTGLDGRTMKHADMDKIYREMPLERIPWNMEAPPDALVNLVEGGIITPCRAIEIGCGAGNYVMYLTKRGFDATGVDISPTAIGIAIDMAVQKGLKCEFITADVLGDIREVEGVFDFAYDWELLHHIMPPDRAKCASNVHRLLATKGKYLSVCFSEKDHQFGGEGKYRKTPLGTELYFSSEDEVEDLYTPLFTINDLKTIEIEGKTAPHMAVYALMQKK
ncbi:class I SAM-dependent methyltransferase [Chloroflexota bacterium]